MSLIVVGVDGSEESREALRWALGEAELRGSTVRAVHAWSLPIAFGGPTMPPQTLDPSALRARAQESLDAAVDEVAGESPSVAVERVVEQGAAADVLVRAAERRRPPRRRVTRPRWIRRAPPRVGQPAVRAARPVRRGDRAQAARGRPEPPRRRLQQGDEVDEVAEEQR